MTITSGGPRGFLLSLKKLIAAFCFRRLQEQAFFQTAEAIFGEAAINTSQQTRPAITVVGARRASSERRLVYS